MESIFLLRKKEYFLFQLAKSDKIKHGTWDTIITVCTQTGKERIQLSATVQEKKRQSTETQYHIFTGLMLTKGDGAEKYNKAMNPSNRI